MLSREKGTYVLVLKVEGTCQTSIGKLGNIKFPKGYYTYTGSALGPGGLRARTGRHLEKNKSCRWHIDYLTRKTAIIEIWYYQGHEKMECNISDALINNGGNPVVPGFGSSDCDCVAHLLYFREPPAFKTFQKKSFPCDLSCYHVTSLETP